MEIRVQRTIRVIPEARLRFFEAALNSVEASEKRMGIEPELFFNVYSNEDHVEVRVFSDFKSMAHYEEVFLGAMLHDEGYLREAEDLVDLILEEPHDEMYVRLKADDYFMHIKGMIDVAPVEPACKFDSESKPSYRREREYCAAKGKLRDVMSLQFKFIRDFHAKTGLGVDYFCTRFSQGRIGSSKAYIDFDDCPMCDPAFNEQDYLIATERSDLLLNPPIDRLYRRITPDFGSFRLSDGRLMP